MQRFVALLRGITPGNPKMRNDNLRRVAKEVGLHQVSTVISSGNVVFEASGLDSPEIEARLESAWPERLGFESTTIVRSQGDLERLVRMRPFRDLEHVKKTYLLVSFAKQPLQDPAGLLEDARASGCEVMAITEREVFTVTDTTDTRSPDVMSWVEGHIGNQVTSRTWLTVHRILNKMGSQLL